MIIFSEKDHKYVHLESGKVLQGWSSLIKEYSKPFDAESWLDIKAYQLMLGPEKYKQLILGRFKQLFNLDPREVSSWLRSCSVGSLESFKNEIKYEWEMSALLGTKEHKILENLAYDQGWFMNPFTDEKVPTVKMEKQYDNQSLADRLYDLPDGFYPELLVWDYEIGQEYSPVTQIDGCFFSTDLSCNKRYCDIIDYKFNFKRPDNSGDSYLAPPLHSLKDTKLQKYKLQVAFGGNLLESHGFEVRRLAVLHYLGFGENKKLKMYMADYDRELMNEFRRDYIGKID